MPLVTVSSKGQVTLPAKARRELGIKPHDKVSVEVAHGALVLRRVPDFFELEGFLHDSYDPEEARRQMAEAVAKHVLGEDG